MPLGLQVRADKDRDVLFIIRQKDPRHIFFKPFF
jgi:hypothetical protein